MFHTIKLFGGNDPKNRGCVQHLSIPTQINNLSVCQEPSMGSNMRGYYMRSANKFTYARCSESQVCVRICWYSPLVDTELKFILGLTARNIPYILAGIIHELQTVWLSARL